MSSRQEEKERRRQERLALEAADARAAARRRRMQIVFGSLLALVLVGGVAVAAIAGLGDDGGGGGGDDDGPRQAETNAAVTLPQQQTSDFEEAAKAAGCELEHPEIQASSHEERQFTPGDYETNPPTSGPHFPTWYEDGIYDPGEAPDIGKTVHTLEHGRINVQYKPGTDAETVEQLEAFVAENGGYHMLLYENATEMDAQVAATAWGQSLTCPEMSPEVFDALRTFRDRYLDKGPETVP